MRKSVLFILSLLLSVLLCDAQQISIPRIDLMPNKPSPYVMREWKQVALDYDDFVFNTEKPATTFR